MLEIINPSIPKPIPNFRTYSNVDWAGLLAILIANMFKTNAKIIIKNNPVPTAIAGIINPNIPNINDKRGRIIKSLLSSFISSGRKFIP